MEYNKNITHCEHQDVGFCSNCAAKIMLSQYKDMLEKEREKTAELTRKLNAFRLLGYSFDSSLTPQNTDAMLTDFAFTDFRTLKVEWSKMDEDTVYSFLALYEKAYNAFAEIAYSFKSKKSIRQHLIDKTK